MLNGNSAGSSQLSVESSLFQAVDSFFAFPSICSLVVPRTWNVSFMSSNFTGSNNYSTPVNSQGYISIYSSSTTTVGFDNVSFSNIKLDGLANGAISVHGPVQSFSVQTSSFNNIKSGNFGGVLFLNISSYNVSYASNSFILNSVCCILLCDFLFYFICRILQDVQLSLVVQFIMLWLV
jgi:hypothetical protein